MAPTVTTTDYAPRVHPCPVCGAECPRHSVYTRRVKDISLGGPVVLEVRVGRYRCAACRKFHQPDLPFAGKGKRYTTRAVRKATVTIQEDKGTYTGLPRRLDRDFAIRPAKSTGWRWFQSFAGSIDVEEYLRWACSRFSGQISVDSVADGGKKLWFATDPLNKDLILGYHFCDSDDAESLTTFLARLRDDYGLKPALFTGDDAAVFDFVPEAVWPGVRLQLCHFHVIKRFNHAYLKHSLRARFNAIKPQKPILRKRPTTAEGRARVKERFRLYREELARWTEAFRRRRLFMKSMRTLAKKKSVAGRDAEYLDEMCRRHPGLATFRAFMLDLYSLLGCKDAAIAGLLRLAFIAKWTAEGEVDGWIGYLLSQFSDDRWFGKLFQFARYENGHRTTNSTERANRWFRKRQKMHYRNRKPHTIRNMLHADLIYRRERSDPTKPPQLLRPKANPLPLAAEAMNSFANESEDQATRRR